MTYLKNILFAFLVGVAVVAIAAALGFSTSPLLGLLAAAITAAWLVMIRNMKEQLNG